MLTQNTKICSTSQTQIIPLIMDLSREIVQYTLVINIDDTSFNSNRQSHNESDVSAIPLGRHGNSNYTKDNDIDKSFSSSKRLDNDRKLSTFGQNLRRRNGNDGVSF
jgi:hypothetical protein